MNRTEHLRETREIKQSFLRKALFSQDRSLLASSWGHFVSMYTYICRSYMVLVSLVYVSGESEIEKRLVQLKSGVYIDTQEQVLDNCVTTEEDGWLQARIQCEERGLTLCSKKEYFEAYGILVTDNYDMEKVGPPSVVVTQAKHELAFAITRDSYGCKPNEHFLIARFFAMQGLF